MAQYFTLNSQFPTILELLDIDIPVVEALVKDRSSVNSNNQHLHASTNLYCLTDTRKS